ncbi:hypothetical protein C8Q79DRAFT_11144 [Trametes meyenii]|nr:hypothetical protein C8Q79DRAFT_11144 [Trametes meyenii]
MQVQVVKLRAVTLWADAEAQRMPEEKTEGVASAFSLADWLYAAGSAAEVRHSSPITAARVEDYEGQPGWSGLRFWGRAYSILTKRHGRPGPRGLNEVVVDDASACSMAPAYPGVLAVCTMFLLMLYIEIAHRHLPSYCALCEAAPPSERAICDRISTKFRKS